MKFITSEKVRNVWFLNDGMGALLKDANIPLKEVIKLPDYSNKLSMDDIIAIGELQLLVANAYGKTFMSPFIKAGVNEIFTAKFKEVVNSIDSNKLKVILSKFNQFYVRAFEDQIFIGCSTAGNPNTFFKSSNSFTALDSPSLEKALVEAIYKSVMYQELHFQKNIIVKADEISFADVLAGLGKIYH